MMKKISIALCLLLLTSAAFAGIEGVAGYDNETAQYYQFTHDAATHTGSYVEVANPKQPWTEAHQIQLTIGAKCDLWVSNYVNKWYLNEWNPNPIADLHGNIYDMAAGNYGATQLNGDKTWVGTGDTTTITYNNIGGDPGIEVDGQKYTNDVTAYFVGSFEGGEVISLWMTTLPEDGSEKVDMTQLVQDADNHTTLVSRVIDTHDLAGNVRVNFGIDNGAYGDGVGIGREFVAFGVTDPAHSGGPSGQPLPGAMATCLLAMGAVAAAKKMKKRA